MTVVAAETPSWWRSRFARRELLRPACAVVGTVIVFLDAWTVIHFGFFTRHPLIDTPIYEGYGDSLVHGLVPFRDFAVTYPPASLPVFVLPSWLAGVGNLGAYKSWFDYEMAVCGVLTVALAAYVLGRREAHLPRLLFGMGVMAASPLLLGPVVLSHYDFWPALLTIAALAAIVGGWELAGFALLALAVAAKVYPAVLIPLAAIYVWRTSSRRKAIWCYVTCAGVLAASILPFVALAPSGVWASMSDQLTRPLQIESLGAELLIARYHAFGGHLNVNFSHGSENIVGNGSGPLATATSTIEILLLLAIWLIYLRGPATQARLLTSSAAAVAAFVAFNKVLSPQYMIWLIPLVPLTRGRRGVAATVLLAAALVLTQTWFPYRYWNLVYQTEPNIGWFVLARDLVLVTLALLLAWPDIPLRQLIPRRAPSPTTTSNTETPTAVETPAQNPSFSNAARAT